MIHCFKNLVPDNRIITYINSVQTVKNIGLVDWWPAQDNLDLNELKQFLESVDLTIFVNIEILKGSASIDIVNSALNLISNYNVSYVTFSEEEATRKWPAERTFNMPWFAKSPVYVPEGFEPDWEYREKEYNFNLLLGRRKPERDLLWRALRNNPEVYATYYGHPEFKFSSDDKYDEKSVTDQLAQQDVTAITTGLKTMTPQGQALVGDVVFIKFLSHMVPELIYKNTHADIVVETQCVIQGLHFLTEKTAKPMATGRPFLLLAPQNTYEYMTKFNFDPIQTSNYFFYSDPIQQISALLDLVDELSDKKAMQNFYQTTLDIRRSNHYQYQLLIKKFDNMLKQWIVDQLNLY